MRFLLIHTAAGEGSVALGDTELSPPIVASEILPGRTSSERLIPTVRGLMAAREWKLSDLAAVVVVHGPGSFTGVRVGVSAAKGLSEAGGVPLVAISRLALLASCVDGNGGSVHAVIDAGRGQFYYGEYVGQRCQREKLMDMQDMIYAAAGGLVVVCEAKVAEVLADLRPAVVDEPSAGAVLPLAVAYVAEGRFEDVATLDANYLRQTDAEIFAKPAASSSSR